MATMNNNKIAAWMKTSERRRNFGYAVGEVFEQYNPVAATIIRKSRNAREDARRSMNSIARGNVSSATKRFMNQNTSRSNLDELSSGSFYTSIADTDTSSDYVLNTEDWGDEKVSTAKEVISQNSNNKAQVGSDMAKVMGYSSAKSAEYIVRSNNAASRALYDLTGAGFNQVTNVLLSMDAKMESLTSLGNSLNAHMQNSAVFYVRTTDSLNKIRDNLDILVKQAESYNKKPNSYGVTGAFPFIKKGGALSLENIYSMGSGIKGKKPKNMNEALTMAMIQMLIPEAAKGAMSGLNMALSSAIINSIFRGGDRARGSNNILVSKYLSKLFPKNSEPTEKTSRSKYHQGSMAWDGVARKSLVEVIPTYLAKTVALLGGEERYYDYETGKFIKVEKIKAREERKIQYAAQEAGGDFRGAIIDKIKTDHNNSDKLRGEVEQFFFRAFVSGDDFFEIRKNLNNTSWLKKYGLSKESAKIIAGIIAEAESSQGTRRNMATRFESNVYMGRRKMAQRNSRNEYYGTDMRNLVDPNYDDDSDLDYKQKDPKDDFYGDVKSYINSAVDGAASKGGRKGKLAKSAQALRKVYTKPYEAVSNALDAFTYGINTFFWGDGQSIKGIFTKFEEKFDELVNTVKDAIKDKFGKVKEWLRDKYESTGLKAKVDSVKAAGKETWGNMRAYASDKVGNFMFGTDGISKFIPKSLAGKTANVDIPTDNGTAARGRRVTRTGIITVSEGELVIPSEYNPFYRGRTNKRSQINNERRITNRFYGNYAEGGTVEDEESKGFGARFKNSGVAGLMKDGANVLANGIGNFLHASIFGKEKEQDDKKIYDVMGKTFGEVKNAKGEMFVGGLAGAGVSLLTGAVVGPLAGAAIGAGVGLMSKSSEVQKFLFGYEDEDGKFNEGLFKKDMDKSIKKTAKGMGLGGGLGLAAGTLFGSPVVGLLAGSALGFAATSENVKKAIFGEYDEDGKEIKEGFIPKSVQDKLKAAAPNMAAGAIAGAAIGPFGMVGNIVLGTAIGYASKSEGFHKFLFGDGDKDKGLAGLVKDKIVNNIDDIAHNANNLIEGLMSRVTTKLFDTIKLAGNKLADFLKKQSMKNTLLGKAINKGTELAKGLIKAPVNLAGKALGAVNTGLKKANLNQGFGVYDQRAGRDLTAKERSQLRTVIRNGGVYQDPDTGAYYQVSPNGQRKEITQRKFESLVAKNAKGKQYKFNSKFGKIDNLLADISEDELKRLEEMGDESLTEYLSEKTGKKISHGDLKQVRKLLKTERGVRFNPEDQKDKQEKENHQNIESIKKILMKQFNIEDPDDKPKFRSETDMFGNVHLYDENGEEVQNDSNTDNSRKIIDKFTDSINKLPGIGTAIGGLKSMFGSFKEKLLGSEDGKKEGLFGKMLGFLNGEGGPLAWLASLFTGTKVGALATGAKALLANPKLLMANMIGGVVGPTLLFGGLTGKFDGLISALGELSIFKGNDTKSAGSSDSTKAITKDGKEIILKTDANGNPIKDANGNYIDINGNPIGSSEVSSLKSYGANNTLSSQLKENTLNGLLRGKSSIASLTLKKANKSLSSMASTVAGKDINLAKSAINGGKNVAKAASNMFASFCETGLPKILRNIPFLNLSDDAIELIGTSLYTHVDDILKAGGKKVASFAGKLAKFVPYLNIAIIVGRAIDSWGNAESILGITEKATFGQKCIAACIGAINAAIPGIGDLIPDKVFVNIFMKIAPMIGWDVSGLQEQRDQATAEVEAYNKENGTNYSIEEYNQEVKGRGGIFTKAGKAIKSGFNTAKEKFTTKMKENGGGIKGAAKAVFDTINTSTGGTELIKLAMKGDIKGFLGYGAVGEDGKVDAKSLISSLPSLSNKISLLPVAVMGFAAHKAGDLIKGIVDKCKQAIEFHNTQITHVDSVLKGEKSFSELFKVEGIEDSPISGIVKASVIVQRMQMVPMLLFKKAGEKVVNGLGKIAKGFLNYHVDSAKKLIEMHSVARTGSVQALWDVDTEPAEDNPMGGIFKAMMFGGKLVYTPIALTSWVGNKIKEGLGTMVDATKEDIDKTKTALKNMSDNAKEGTVESLLKIMTEDSSMNKLNPIRGINSGIINIGKVIYSVVGLVNLISEPLSNAIDFVKKKVLKVVDDTKDFVTDKVDKVKESKVGKAASKVWKGITDWYSGSGSGFVSQYDPRYQGYNVSGVPFASKGCGPAVASMAASAMGKRLSVADAVNASRGYETSNGVTMDYFQSALGSRGIRTEVIAGGSSADLYNRIAGGDKVILLGRDATNTSKENSPFGPNNHYVLATGVDRRGNVIVNDPESNRPRSYNPSILRNAQYGIAGSGSRVRNRMFRTKLHYLVGGDSSQVAAQVWNFLKSQGFTEQAAAGVMGNLEQETHMNPALENSVTCGIACWDNQSGGNPLKNAAKAAGKDWKDLGFQMQFLMQSLPSAFNTYTGRDKHFYDNGEWCWWEKKMSFEQFKKLTSVNEATEIFERVYERASKPMMQKRMEYANQYYQQFTGKEGEPIPVTGSSYSGSTSSGPSRTADSSASSSSGSKPKSVLQMAASIGSIFSEALGKIFNGSSDSTGSAEMSDNQENQFTGNIPPSSGAVVGTGTPVKGNRANNFPYYNQADSPWGSQGYGSSGTVKSSGCGPTSMAMVLRSYGIETDPSQTAAWSVKNGHRVEGQGTSWGFFDAIGKQYGLTTNHFSDIETAKNSLAAGIPVIASMRPGDFTTGGHFLVFSGINGDKSTVTVNDPGSRDRTGKVWDANNALGQAKGFWAISKDGKGSIGSSTPPVINSAADALAWQRQREQMAAAGSGLPRTSSGILNRANFSNNRNVTYVSNSRTGTMVPISFTGGDSSIVANTTGMLSNLQSSLRNARTTSSGGGVSADLVNKLLESITSLLQSIANNTAPIEKIHNALLSYMSSGGGSKAPNEKVETVKSPKQTPAPKTEVDSSISALAGILAELAKG